MTFLVAAVVVLLIMSFMLGGWEKMLGSAPRLLGLKPFQDKAAGTADLLNWAALVDDGIVQTKDGALLAGFFYEGRDIASSTNDERNYITRRINEALANRLGSGWVTWHDAVRMPAPAYSPASASHFADPVTAMIDEERRQHFSRQDQHYESQYAFTVMYLPPAPRKAKLADFLYDDDSMEGGDLPADRTLAHFKKILNELHATMIDVLPLRRMAGFEVQDRVSGKAIRRDELINYLNYTLTGSLSPVNLPPVPMYMDAYMGIDELWVGDTPRIGKTFIQCVSVAGFPHHSSPNVLAVLDTLPIAYRWSTRFIYLNQYEALNELGKYRRKWRQKMTSLMSQVFKSQNPQVDQDAVNMAGDVENAITETNSNLVVYGYYTTNIVLMGDDRKKLEQYATYVAGEIDRAGFKSRIETVNTLEAWLGTLPGHALPNVRRPLMHTLNLADLLPLSSVWAGLPYNPCPFYPKDSPPLMYGATTGATPFRVNLHHGDLGHTLIFGPPGAGKSTMLSLIAAQFRRYRGSTITAFDKGRSMYTLCKAANGNHYDLAGDTGSPGLCPLQYLDSEADAAWAEDWISTCFELQAGHPPTPRQREEIHRAITLLRKQKEGRSLTDFLATVQDQDLRSALAHYTIDGPLGHLLDSRQDELGDSPFSVFEIGELMGMGERNLIPVLLYLFRRFERSLKGQPALLVLDEAWVMLAHIVFRGKIREWLKVLRKANCIVVLATQSLSDAVSSGILDVLMEACPTKILLPNEEADKAGTTNVVGPRDLYALVGLNDAEVDIIKNAQKKRHYYYVSSAGRRLFELQLGPVALSFVAVSDPQTLAQVSSMVEEFGSVWPYQWLKERGVRYEEVRYSKAA